MNRWKIVSLLTIAALLITAVPAFAVEEVREPWTGDPDPYACNTFQDCYWTIPVCIEGVTYEVGIYYDPATQTAEFMEEDALNWSDIVLTFGACPVAKASPIFDGLWAYGNTAEDFADEICYIISARGEPSVDSRIRVCENGGNWPDDVDRPGWVETSYLKANGGVFDDGTPWGYWEGDAVAGSLRLPLRHMDGYWSYLFKEFCHYTAKIGEPKGWCR